MKYAVVINKRVKNMRVVMILKKIHGNENFLQKLFVRMFSGKKQAQPTPALQKWANAR